MTVKRYEITNDVIEKISNPSNWSGDSSRVNFNASSLSSDLGDWGDESVERHIAKQASKNMGLKKVNQQKTCKVVYESNQQHPIRNLQPR